MNFNVVHVLYEWFSGGWVIRNILWIESLLEPAVFLFMLCVNQEVVAPPPL